MSDKSFSTVDICGVQYAVVDYQLATKIVIEKALRRESFGLLASAVHVIAESHWDAEMKSATDQADMIVPDGQPIRWAMNHFYHTNLTDRVYGPFLTLHVLKQANQHGLRVFLYGGNTQATLDGFARYIREHYPLVTICGSYREARPDDDTLTAQQVNDAGTHLLFVGRGCPNQEKWIAKHRGEVMAVMMGIGAAFSFYAGDVSQAPRWMQDHGLEWLYRLIQEPRRLWKRYLFTNTTFICLIAKQALTRALKR